MAKLQLMSLRHSAFYTPYLMTMAGGFLADEGLEYDYTPETPNNTVKDSFADGRCDVSQSAVAASFNSLEKGEAQQIVHFAQINSRDGFFIAAREPGEDFQWQKLKGKKVLVDHFFQPYAMFNYGMHQQGIALSELEVIDAGDVDAIEKAFRDGRADYVHMQGPAPQQMEKDGIAFVVAMVGDAVGPVAFSSLCARREWLETEAARAFVRAYQQSLNYVVSAPAAELAAKEQEAGFFPEIDHRVLSDTIKAYQQLGCWQAEMEISPASYEKLLDVFLYNGAIHQRYDYHDAIVKPPVE
jgi:NitT/TauT family transport system substrate-binding protein